MRIVKTTIKNCDELCKNEERFIRIFNSEKDKNGTVIEIDEEQSLISVYGNMSGQKPFTKVCAKLTDKLRELLSEKND